MLYIYIYCMYVYYVCFVIPKKTLPASYEWTQLFETLAAAFRCT